MVTDKFYLQHLNVSKKLCSLMTHMTTLTRKVSVEIFRCNYPPPDGDKKNARFCHFLARFFKKKFVKNTTRRSICLWCLDGYFCDIKMGLQTDSF